MHTLDLTPSTPTKRRWLRVGTVLWAPVMAALIVASWYVHHTRTAPQARQVGIPSELGRPALELLPMCDPSGDSYLQVVWWGMPAPRDGVIPPARNKGDAPTDDRAHYARITLIDAAGETPVDLSADPDSTDGVWKVPSGTETVTLQWPGVDTITQSVTVPACPQPN
jgi:hypothetical protein